MLKKGCIVLLLAVLVLIFTGCNMSTTVNTDENGKGTVSYKINLKKGAFEGTNYIVAKDIDEFASTLKSRFDPSLNLIVTVDKTSSNEENYIIISYSYNNIEEYDKFVDDVLKKFNSLIGGINIYEMYGYDKEDDGKDYTVELESLNEYMIDKDIQIDTNHRNCRKFVKIIKEYIQEAKISCGVRQTKGSNKEYAKIIEDENGKKLCVNYMALNCIDMYTKKIVEKYKSDFFKTDYIDQNEAELTSYGNKEVLKRTFEAFDLATKIKNSIDNKNGGASEQYSMNEFTPVMTVKLFDENNIKEFKNIYVEQRKLYEEERIENMNNLKLSLDEMEDMYSDREKTYEIIYGNNKVSFSDDEIFDLCNEDGFICVNNKVSNSKEEISSEETLENKESNSINNPVIINELDKTPLTGDIVRLNIIVMVAIFSLIFIFVIFFVEKKKKRM